MTDYRNASNEELLNALEHAGRVPAEALVDACLERGEALVPGLLKMLEGDYDETWEQDDPRWYRDVHAGLLLIEMQAEEALPVFDALLRDRDRIGYLIEWFNLQLPRYESAIVPWMTALLTDEGAEVAARIAASEVLSYVGTSVPAERETVLDALRSVLPADEDGTVTVAVPPEEVPVEDIELWSFVLAALVELQDRESRPQVEALYEAGLIDETIIGEVEQYRFLLEDRPPRREPQSIRDFYGEIRRREEAEAEWARRREKEEAERALRGDVKQTAERRSKRVEDDESEREVYRVVETGRTDIGRNERVTVRDPETGEVIEDIKYKHVQDKLDAGWTLVGR